MRTQIVLAALFTLASSISASERIVVPYASVKPVLDALASELPPQLQPPKETKWNVWAQRENAFIRARLEQGALDSMVNLLLFGTSFTDHPRASFSDDSENSMLQSRLDDLLRALRSPGDNERLAFVRQLIRHKEMNIDTPAGLEQARTFVLENFRRVVQEENTFEKRFDEASGESNRMFGLSKRSRMYRDRGISLDTTILSSFGIDGALRDMQARGMFRTREITRVAIIGPGLDFTDKKAGYDFYPQQTLQTFGVYDSLVRFGLAKAGNIDITAFDISSEVLAHLRRARERARAGQSYVVQLPREARPWVADAVKYWRSFGTEIGQTIAPIKPPLALDHLETRAVRIRPDVVLSCKPADLNIIVEQLDLPAKERFDLVVATNVFIYYDTLEQALALRNVSTLLKPGGFLLTNDLPPQLPETQMRRVGYTSVRYAEGAAEGDNIFWWTAN